MSYPRWMLRSTAAAVAGLTIAAALPTGLASAKTVTGGPTIKLVNAQNNITVARYGKRVYLDPGIYVTALGAPLQFDVQRAGYGKPLTISEVIRVPGKPTVVRPLPAWTLQGWTGLHRFLRMTVKNAAGKTVAEHMLPFCPDSWDAQRSSPDSAGSSHFPMSCEFSPFQLSNAWGIQRGWGVDPLSNFNTAGRLKLALGKYTVTMHITWMWRRFLHIRAADAASSVNVTVVKPGQCSFPCLRHPATTRPPAATRQPLPSLPASVPVMNHPPASILPDLVPLPSSNIRTIHFRNTPTSPSSDQLTFGATVWVGGHSRLDVEGFRSNGSPTMRAYQYFWKNGRVIGRTRAGTMGFDSKLGHVHWHFQQFAQYRLLNATKTVAVRSQKVGFCIAPTGGIDLLLPHALWQPRFFGFGGSCGSPSALWVREMLPLGWGDTYFQWVAGQAFNISHLPNGTYYIEVIANPGKVLHESNYGNDSSLRKVILGGTPGHRTVRVPAYHGIDPEG